MIRGVTGTAAANLPKSIEELTPSIGATNVPNQSTIFVDLEAGYTGELIVDDVLLPTISEDEVRDVAPGEQAKPALGTVYAEGNATLTFQPVTGAPIESLDEGLHRSSCATGRSPTRTRSASSPGSSPSFDGRGLASARLAARFRRSPPAAGSLAVAPPRLTGRSTRRDPSGTALRGDWRPLAWRLAFAAPLLRRRIACSRPDLACAVVLSRRRPPPA